MDERLDDLNAEGLKIFQKQKGFHYGTDAVLLSDFVLIKPHAVAADLGTGTGVIALLMAAKKPVKHIDALELQCEICDMARRSVALNGLQDRIRVIQGDIRKAPQILGCGIYDTVVCNPPYFKSGDSLPSEDESRLISRTDVSLTLDELCASAFRLLKSRGRLCVVYPASEMHRLTRTMEENGLSPKRIRTVHATSGHAPSLVLLDAVKQGGSQLHWEPPLILRHANGSCTEEWIRIYGREG